MPVEITDQYIRVQVRNPGTFDEDTFRTIVLSAEQGDGKRSTRLSRKSSRT